MKHQEDRLRFFATLFSVYGSRRHGDHALTRWLADIDHQSTDGQYWEGKFLSLRTEAAAAIDVDLTDLIEEQVFQMVKRDIDVVVRGGPAYPVTLELNLRNKAPNFLWFRGRRNLFDRVAVGFCGSRHASEIGLEVCADIVEQLVERNVVIVAGYAAGVDQVAHLSALKHGGGTIAVLAEGILNFNVRQLLADAWDWDRALVVSEFLPQKRWAVGQAMQRNRTIFGLAKGLVVIEAKESGGTFEAGKDAIAFKHPLFAPIYGSIEDNVAGNKILISRGAVPIMKSRSTGRAKIDPLLPIIAPEAHAAETNSKR